MRIYYINLDRRTDRRSEMEAQFQKLALDAERISAMTPAQISEDQKTRHCDPRNWNWMTEAELSCSLSHLKAMEAFLATDADRALILEDDVRMSGALPRFLGALDAQPVRYDVLRLETYLDGQRLMPSIEQTIEGIAIRRSWSWCAGAAAYIVSRQAARTILDSGEFLRLQTDGALFNPYESLSRQLVVRHCFPGLAVQLDRLDGNRKDSDLAAARKRHEEPVPLPWPKRTFRKIAGILKTEIIFGSQRQFHTIIGGARKVLVPFRTD